MKRKPEMFSAGLLKAFCIGTIAFFSVGCWESSTDVEIHIDATSDISKALVTWSEMHTRVLFYVSSTVVEIEVPTGGMVALPNIIGDVTKTIPHDIDEFGYMFSIIRFEHDMFPSGSCNLRADSGETVEKDEDSNRVIFRYNGTYNTSPGDCK